MGDTLEVGVKRGKDQTTQQWDLVAKINAKMSPQEWEAFKHELCALFKKHHLKPPAGLKCP